jgi:hypothetical protein
VQIYAGYQGFIFVEPDTGIVRRLIANTSGIPSEYAISKGDTVLEYGPVDIAREKYFLLTQATSYVKTKQYEVLFRKKFARYHKFQVDASIHF